MKKNITVLMISIITTSFISPKIATAGLSEEVQNSLNDSSDGRPSIKSTRQYLAAKTIQNALRKYKQDKIIKQVFDSCATGNKLAANALRRELKRQKHESWQKNENDKMSMHDTENHCSSKNGKSFSEYLKCQDVQEVVASFLEMEELNSFSLACTQFNEASRDQWEKLKSDYLKQISKNKVALGNMHTCAVMNRTLRCWGNNRYGQLKLPVDLGPVKSVFTGNHTTCATLIDDTLRCWGENYYEQTTVPADLGPVQSVAAGNEHTCAKLRNGRVRCWGNNYHGQTTVPADLGPVQSIAVGDDHTCARSKKGTVRCWGNHADGQTTVPPDLGPVKSIATGIRSTCVVLRNGKVRCWGNNDEGQTNVPKDLEPVQSIATKDHYTCVTLRDGAVRCWGYHWDEQKIPPLNLEPVKSLALGGSHLCATLRNGALQCWGSNQWGQTTVPEGLRIFDPQFLVRLFNNLTNSQWN